MPPGSPHPLSVIETGEAARHHTPQAEFSEATLSQNPNQSSSSVPLPAQVTAQSICGGEAGRETSEAAAGLRRALVDCMRSKVATTRHYVGQGATESRVVANVEAGAPGKNERCANGISQELLNAHSL